MTDAAKFAGMFHGISFGLKKTADGFVQTAGLNFQVDLDESGLGAMKDVIGWQKQPVCLAVARRQADLFDPEEKAQGKLPLAPPATPATRDPAAVRANPVLLAEAPEQVWRERSVGPQGEEWVIFIRGDGQAFGCLECGGVFDLNEGEVLEEELAAHVKIAHREEEQVCRVCGCTEDNACPGGCRWVENDLCSNPECLLSAGYGEKEIADIAAGNIPVIYKTLGGEVKVVCADGVTREFEFESRDGQIDALACNDCGEAVVRRAYSRGGKGGLPTSSMYGLMRNHRCPALCHKCRAKEKHGDALAELLILHRSGCPNSYPDPSIDGLMYQLTQRSYAQRILEAFALDPKSYIGYAGDHVTRFILEDAAEALARVEELAGIQPPKMRPETYGDRGIVMDDYRSKSILAELKKVVKEKKDRALTKQLNTLLEGAKEARKTLKDAVSELHKKEMQEESRKSLGKYYKPPGEDEDPDDLDEDPEGAGEDDDEEVHEEGERPSAGDPSNAPKIVIVSRNSYIDDQGRPLVIADNGEEFGVYRQRKEGGLVRVKNTPLCDTLQEAELALEVFARKCGFLKAPGTKEAPAAGSTQ